MRRLVVIAGLVLGCHRDKPLAPLPPMAHAAYAHYLDAKLAGYRADWPAAADALTAALAAAPDQPMIAVELARAQAKAKRDGAARDTLAAARKRWPDHPQVWLMSGDLLGPADAAEAMRAYRRAIELEPGDERGYLGLAKLEGPYQSEATLRQLVKRVPGSVDGHYRLAVKMATRDDLATAAAHLRAVLELDPDHIDARLDLARTLRRTGHIGEAIAQTRSAFDRSGQALDIAEELYWLLCEADDRTAAIDLLTLLDDDRSDVDALAAIARLDRGLGRLDEAREIAARMASIEADAGTLALAETDLAAGDPARAAKRVMAIAPASQRFGEARRIAAEALLAQGDAKAALAAITPAREAAPLDVDLALVAAYAMAGMGDVVDARTLLAKLGDGVVPSLARARLEDHVDNPTGALAILEPLIRAHPDTTAALNLAGYLLVDAKHRLPDAESWLRRARELSPGDPAVLDSWGWLLLRKGDTRGAIRALDRASRFAPREAEVLVHLATAWAADRSPRTAFDLLDRAAALHPSAAVRRRIDALRATLPAPR